MKHAAYNLRNSIYDIVHHSGKYLKNTIAEKVELFSNPKKIYNKMIALGKKEGLPFMAYAIAVEILEDLVLPGVLACTGNSEYIPIVLIGHSEPVMYPLYFGVRKLMKSSNQVPEKSLCL